jgi:hypothetical protein
MNKLKYFLLPALALLCFGFNAPKSHAQVSVSIGAAPDCPYGYYDYAPYNCAPYGYYGTEWFSSGVFIGAGPWFHGSDDFRGNVDNHFDPHNGYKGEAPKRGDKADAGHDVAHNSNFKGNEMRDGRGHTATAEKH